MLTISSWPAITTITPISLLILIESGHSLCEGCDKIGVFFLFNFPLHMNTCDWWFASAPYANHETSLEVHMVISWFVETLGKNHWPSVEHWHHSHYVQGNRSWNFFRRQRDLNTGREGHMTTFWMHNRVSYRSTKSIWMSTNWTVWINLFNYFLYYIYRYLW